LSVKLRAEYKSTLQPVTMTALRAALDELEAHASVPPAARLKVTHYAQGGWEVVATWSPDDKAEGAITVHPSDGLDPEHIRGIQRRIQDNPQA